jgi:hypothetical protein
VPLGFRSSERGGWHEAKVDAESAYEATVLALKQWDARRYVKGPSRATVLAIEVAAPRVVRVRMADVLEWLYYRPSKTRAEDKRK